MQEANKYRLLVARVLAVLSCLVWSISTKKDKNPTALVTIGILAQPASDVMRLQYYHPKENWTFVPGSYVDWIGSTGAMPVLIPFDLKQKDLDRILENIDGILLPGGGADLIRLDDLSKPTPYQISMDYIIKWAMKRNDAGKYFPLFATCLGFEGVIISATNSTKTLECDLDDEVTAHSVQLLPEFDKSPFWKEVGFDLAKRVFARDSIYYTHSCGIRTTSWKNNPILMKEYNLLGTSVAKNGIEFVANIEHKKYPIVSNQWHPEKNPYERGHLYHFLDRSSDATTLMTKIAAKFVNPIREKGAPKDVREIDALVKSYFVSNLMAEYLPLSFYERVYTFQRYNYYE